MEIRSGSGGGPRHVDERGLGRVGFEPTPKWLRARVDGTTIADSREAALLWTGEPVPVYAFPESDLRTDLLEAGATDAHSTLGDRRWYRLIEPEIERAAWAILDPADTAPHTRGYVVLVWDTMDTWLVEEEIARVHPRDPYKRIDVHESSRHVEVEIAGETVAESRRPQILFETGLPPRYYLPRVDVRTDLLEPSETVTRCAYKGEAEHVHVQLSDSIHEDVAWRYPFPNPGLGKIQDRICFYDERVDRVLVDGPPSRARDALDAVTRMGPMRRRPTGGA